MDSNFDQTVFDKLFQLLEPDVQFVGRRFDRCRLKLFRFFVWRRCEDPDSLADETISRLLVKVKAGHEISAENPYSYVYAIANNVFKEYLRARKKVLGQIDIEAFREVAPPVLAADCKKECLAELSEENLELLEHYYLDDDDPNDIALEKGLTLNALRLKVFRLKLGLRRCWENCLNRSDAARN